MPTRHRDNSGTYARRQVRAREEGWTGYGQKRYWTAAARQDQLIHEGNERYGGEDPPGPPRAGSRMNEALNRAVNPRPLPGELGTRVGSWQWRLYVAVRAQWRVSVPKFERVVHGESGSG